MKTIDEMLQLASVSDALLVPAYDYSDLLKIDQLRPFLESRERILESKHILLLRAQSSAQISR